MPKVLYVNVLFCPFACSQICIYIFNPLEDRILKFCFHTNFATRYNLLVRGSCELNILRAAHGNESNRSGIVTFIILMAVV